MAPSMDIANGLWEQMGVEHDAFWGLDGTPKTVRYYYYATTRDYARLAK